MTMSPISARLSPFSPRVMAPMGRTWHRPACMGAVDLVADLGTGVGDRVGVGHGGHVSEAAVDRSRGAGLDGLLVLEARVTEVDVHVHQAGDEVLAGRRR